MKRKTPRRNALVLRAALLLAPGHALAHHGKDFLLAETYDLPHPHEVYLTFPFDRVAGDDGTDLEASPSFLVGVNRRVAFELHGHLDRAPGDRWRYEATAPTLHLHLTPPDSSAPWRVGLSAEYEIAREHDADDRFEGRLVVSRKRDDANLTVNLIAEQEQQGERDVAWGYALGFRPYLDRRIGWGLEAQGSFEQAGPHEVLAGLYGEPSERLTLKLGLGTGLGPESPHLTARGGIVFRF